LEDFLRSSRHKRKISKDKDETWRRRCKKKGREEYQKEESVKDWKTDKKGKKNQR
jgi:hypothetical protein